MNEIRRRCKAQHLAFEDHHAYNRQDIARIRDTFAALPGTRKIIITTEKDAIRLHGLVNDLPVYIQPIEVAFHKDNNLDFDQVIESSVRENISFLHKLSIWS